MISLGIVLIILGLVLPAILTTGFTYGSLMVNIGLILLVVGLVLMVVGRMGHAVGGRRHYY